MSAVQKSHVSVENFLNVYLYPQVNGGFAILDSAEASFAHSLRSYKDEITNLLKTMNPLGPDTQILGSAGMKATIEGVLAIIEKTLSSKSVLQGAEGYFEAFVKFIGTKLDELNSKKDFLIREDNEYHRDNKALIEIYQGQYEVAKHALKLLRDGDVSGGVNHYIVESIKNHRKLGDILEKDLLLQI